MIALLAVCMSTAVATAGPKVDRVTGTCVFSPGDSVWTFSAYEAYGTPGTRGYRPAGGWVSSYNYYFQGVWPVVECNVMNDNEFVLVIDVNGTPVRTYIGYDGGQPGWKFDTSGGGLYTVTSGNIQVHNYSGDGD